MNFLTHAHTHNCRCTQHYLVYIQCLQPAACLLLHWNCTIHWLHFSIPTYTHDSVWVFIWLKFMDDKISWLGRWANQWRLPHIHLHHLYEAYMMNSITCGSWVGTCGPHGPWSNWWHAKLKHFTSLCLEEMCTVVWWLCGKVNIQN